MVSLYMKGEGDDDLYNDNKDNDIDNKNVDYEDDLDSDAYLEHLISNAMKEGISTKQRKAPPDKSTNSDNVSSLEDTKRMMEQQQQQIDLLMKMVQSQQPKSSSGNHQNIMQDKPAITKQKKALNVTPLKIMFFIDGTWLYYSMHARKDDRCTVTRKFGKGWQASYKVDW